MFDIQNAQSAFTWWKDLAELLKDVLESLAIIAGSLALIKWFTERHDRATDVLLQLETRFQDPEIQNACHFLEDETEYLTNANVLQMAVRSSANLWPDSELNKKQPARNQSPLERVINTLLVEPAVSTPAPFNLGQLDKLLRFYVVMHGFRKARQIPDAALRTCYRYWLAHYFHTRRPAFRAYVDHFYPTLRNWLATEKAWYKRDLSRPSRFFRAGDFWNTREDCLLSQLRVATEGRVLVIAGAGLSAESGIPTFRDKGGFWQGYDPRELATKRAFERDPAKVWEFYRERRAGVRSHSPNAAHHALVELSLRVRDTNNFLLVTQNVDGYELSAGLNAARVVQIHGDILKTRCSNPKCNYSVRATDQAADDVPGACKNKTCDGILRPDVVWFDEDFRPGDEERVKEFLKAGSCDVVFVIGTSATFDYIADWAFSAVANDGWLIEINPHPSDIARFAHVVFKKPAGKVLPKLMKQLKKGEPKRK